MKWNWPLRMRRVPAWLALRRPILPTSPFWTVRGTYLSPELLRHVARIGQRRFLLHPVRQAPFNLLRKICRAIFEPFYASTILRPNLFRDWSTIHPEET